MDRFERKKDRFGIDVMGTCRRYESDLAQRLENGEDPSRLLSRHLERLRWLQHERLVHFLVTSLTAVCSILLFMLFVSSSQTPGVLALLLLMVVLTGCYLFHYFRLENAVQHWYHIGDILDDEACSRERNGLNRP